MCLALPVKVVKVGADGTALVELGGVRKEISLVLVDEVQVGDYVILHAGYALARLDPDEAAKTLALFAELDAAADAAADGDADSGADSDADSDADWASR